MRNLAAVHRAVVVLLALAVMAGAAHAENVLVLVRGQNLDETTSFVEAKLAEELAARGYDVVDRSGVNWAKAQATLSGSGPGGDAPWLKQVRDRFDLVLVGWGKTREGRTPPALSAAGMTSVQARLTLKLYDANGWTLVSSVSGRGAGAHIDPYSAGEVALERALEGVKKDLFAQRIAAEGSLRQRAAAQQASAPEPAEPEVDEALLASLPETTRKNPDAVAVVIGNRDYKNTKNVNFAINDAALMKEYLVKSLGYREGNIFFVRNATKGDFELYFGSATNEKGKLFNAVKPGRSDVFIYYAGHGAPGINDKKGYFVPVEAEPNYVEVQGYSTELLYDNLAKIPARNVTVVTDACFSGANYENISPIGISFEQPAMKVPNAVIFNSSAGTQVSSWYNEKKHGLFTWMFANGVADLKADLDGDGAVTYKELHSYVNDNSEGVPYLARKMHNVEQTPTMVTTRGQDVLFEK